MFLIKLFFIFILSFGLENIETSSDLKRLNPYEYEEFLDKIENSNEDKRFTYAESDYFKASLLREASFKPQFTNYIYDPKTKEYNKVKVLLTDQQLSQIVKGFNTHGGSIIDDFEVSGENVTSVGDVDVEVVIYLMGADLVGTKYRLFQAGAYHEEETYGPHFDNEVEAINAGWDTGADVSWSNYFI